MDNIYTDRDIQLEVKTKEKSINFLGYAPCSMKHDFREALDEIRGAYREETGTTPKGYILEDCSHRTDNIYHDIWKSPTIEDFPNAVASDGFDDLFRQEFIERFVKKGHFKSAWNQKFTSLFENTGFRDPDEWYTIYAISPFILLIDKKRLGDLPIPESWEDILDPKYRNKIIMSGAEGHPGGVPLLYYYKEYGLEGIKRLAANIRTIWHAAQIARSAGLSNSSGAPIYIQSLFFAKCCPRTEATAIIWPQEGAYTSPIYYLVKKSKMKEVEAVTNYITGIELGKKCALSYFPSLHPQVDNNLPDEATFNWLGWDYIKTHNIPEMIKYLRDIFLVEMGKKNKEFE